MAPQSYMRCVVDRTSLCGAYLTYKRHAYGAAHGSGRMI